MKSIIRPSVSDKISRFPSVWNHLLRPFLPSMVSSFLYIVQRILAVTRASTPGLCNESEYPAHLHQPRRNISNLDASTEKDQFFLLFFKV